MRIKRFNENKNEIVDALTPNYAYVLYYAGTILYVGSKEEMEKLKEQPYYEVITLAKAIDKIEDGIRDSYASYEDPAY